MTQITQFGSKGTKLQNLLETLYGINLYLITVERKQTDEYKRSRSVTTKDNAAYGQQTYYTKYK